MEVEKGRETGILVIAASIIAVIRLRGQDPGPPATPGLGCWGGSSLGSSWRKWRESELFVQQAASYLFD